MNREIDHLLYKNYLVEQEMLDRLAIIEIKKSSSVITESELIQLNEDVKDTVMTAIRKVMANIQEVWNRFKNTFIDEVEMKRINQYEKYYNTNFSISPKAGQIIPVIGEYHKMLDENIPQFTEAMLDELDNDKEFIKKYMNYFYDQEKTPTQVAEGKILEEEKETGTQTVISSAEIRDYKAVVEKAKEVIDKIGSDIQKLNSSSRTIENLVNLQSQNASADISTSYKYYFNEAEEDADKSSGGFTSANPEDNKPKDEKKTSPDIAKKISKYFSICNSVLSTKLSTANKVRKASTNIVVAFGKLQAERDKSGAKMEEDNTKEKTSNNGATTVEI